MLTCLTRELTAASALFDLGDGAGPALVLELDEANALGGPVGR